MIQFNLIALTDERRQLTLFQKRQVFFKGHQVDWNQCYLYQQSTTIMISKNVQKDKQFQFSINQSNIKSAQTQITSKFIRQYFRLLEQGTILQNQSQSKLQETYQSQFNKYGIKFVANSQWKQFSIQITKESINSEAVFFNISWGKFIGTLSALNSKSNSITHNYKIGRGNYGSIYHVQFQKDEFVTKCVQFNHSDYSHIGKLMAIKQLFLIKISAALKVGPNVQNWLGFDLIIYENCIQFAIQKCQNISKFNYQINLQLKNNLLLLHDFKLIHFDLKPQNIMFSKTFQKYIFIDYGLSQIISNVRGKKSVTAFKGTLTYASFQMIKIFESQTMNYADLYYNDAICLQKAVNILKIQSIQQSLEKYLINNVQQFEPNNQLNKLILFRFKYLIFAQSSTSFITYYKQQFQLLNQFFILQILTFMFELIPNQETKYFYNSIIQSHHKQNQQFKQLSQIYSSNLHFKNIQIKQKKRNLLHYKNIKIINCCSTTVDCDKITLQNILKDKQTKISQQAYLKLFLKYISFTNNIHKVTAEERQFAAQNIRKKYLSSQQIKIKHKGIYLNSQTIKLLFLTFIQKQYHKTIEYIKQKLTIKQNLFNLLELIFILKIPKCQQMLKWLDCLYNKTYLSVYDRLQLTIRVKNNNYWYSFSINNCHQDEKKDQLSFQVNLWCQRQFQKLVMNQNSDINSISSYFLKKQECGRSLQKIINQSSDLDSSFRQLLIFQLHFNNISYSNSKQFHKAIDSVYKQVSNNQRNKLFYFLFIIFDFTLKKQGNLQKCEQIYAIFNKNLNDPKLNSGLLFHPFMQLTLYKIDIKKYLNNIKMIDYFLNNLSLTMLNIHFQIVNVCFMHFQYLITNIIWKPQQMYLKQSILNRMKVIYNKLDLYLQYIHKQSKSNHKCFDFIQIQNWSVLKSYLNIFVKSQPNQNLNILKLQNRSNCLNCELIKNNIILIEHQTQVINNWKLQTKGQQFKIAQIYKQIMINYSLQKSFPINVQHSIKQNLQLFAYFCRINEQYQLSYGGIRLLYFYLKKRQLLNCYLHFSPFSVQNCSKTMWSLYKYQSQAELISFITSLSDLLTKYFSVRTFEILLSSFDLFLTTHSRQINYNHLFILLLETLQKQKQKTHKQYINNSYSLIYQFCLLSKLIQPQFTQCLLSIANKLKFLSLRIRIVFQSHIYSLLYSNGSTFKCHQRKRKVFKLKISKLICIQGIKTNQMKGSSKKRSKQKIQENIKILKLKIKSNLVLQKQ